MYVRELLPFSRVKRPSVTAVWKDLHSSLVDLPNIARACAASSRPTPLNCTVLPSSRRPLRTATQAAETTAARVRQQQQQHRSASVAAATATAATPAAVVRARSTAQSGALRAARPPGRRLPQLCALVLDSRLLNCRHRLPPRKSTHAAAPPPAAAAAAAAAATAAATPAAAAVHARSTAPSGALRCMPADLSAATTRSHGRRLPTCACVRPLDCAHRPSPRRVRAAPVAAARRARVRQERDPRRAKGGGTVYKVRIFIFSPVLRRVPCAGRVNCMRAELRDASVSRTLAQHSRFASAQASTCRRAAVSPLEDLRAPEALKLATHSTEHRRRPDPARAPHLAVDIALPEDRTVLVLPPSQAQTTLKQCLHFHPYSKPCAALHSKSKKFDKAFAKLNALRETGDWRGVVAHLFGTSSKESALGNAFASVSASVSSIKRSERRKDVVRALCQAYVSEGESGFRKKMISIYETKPPLALWRPDLFSRQLPSYLYIRPACVKDIDTSFCARLRSMASHSPGPSLQSTAMVSKIPIIKKRTKHFKRVYLLLHAYTSCLRRLALLCSTPSVVLIIEQPDAFNFLCTDEPIRGPLAFTATAHSSLYSLRTSSNQTHLGEVTYYARRVHANSAQLLTTN
ncbi:hypothetical protein DFH11DRAFT_1834422 [Phellopilus nigrolimitatus]|nr:hypothetical protein DFH11DRAFT_1834409 [Phellopilus nigrolimitatus]KAH8115604.1 hypothetical protein DFH11DRAFT_1834422 [Phellopilus nigrolimitatus]